MDVSLKLSIVDIVPSGDEGVYELLDNKFLIFEEEALRKLEEAMA